MPVSPGWYDRPATLEDLIAGFVGRVLQLLGVEQPDGWRAGDLETAARPEKARKGTP
jgi:3-polyprenyl-4-hydroxybenzoate decarboxylase